MEEESEMKSRESIPTINGILEEWLNLQKKIKEEITLEDICKNK